jgi:hypothetical protein
MHDVEAPGFLRFVRLQVADQMPADREVRGLVHFLERFLNFVLAEIDLTEIGGGANAFNGKCLGDGDEADGGGVASGPAGGSRDARANVCQPGAERCGVDHYFLIVARIPFAVAAFGPVGASLR